jgi:hypothetical protein
VCRSAFARSPRIGHYAVREFGTRDAGASGCGI